MAICKNAKMQKKIFYLLLADLRQKQKQNEKHFTQFDNSYATKIIFISGQFFLRFRPKI